MRSLSFAIALALAGCASLPADPHSSGTARAPHWRAVSSETGKIVDLAGLEELAASFPDSSSPRLRLLAAQIESGDWDSSFASLRWLNTRGYIFSASARAELEEKFGAERAAAVRTVLLAPAPAIARSTLAATIPAEAGLVESVLVVPENAVLAATSVSGRCVWLIDSAQSARPVCPEGAGNLSGIVYDPSRTAIWAASGHLVGKIEGEIFSGLIEIVPGRSDGRRITTPDGATLSDLHRASDGTIYASAPLGGGIYRLSPGAQTFETLVAPGILRSPQGLVTSEDGERLYVSDYRYGIAIVGIKTGRVSRLATSLPIILDGIDGLWRNGNELIAMQNGSKPMRIVGLTLSGDGARVIGQRIIEQAHPEWTEPLSGYLEDDALYYVANGQWDRMEDGLPFGPTYIFKLPVGDGRAAH